MADNETIMQECEALCTKVDKVWLKTSRCQEKAEKPKSSTLSLG